MIPKILHFIWIPGMNQAPDYAWVNIGLWKELNPDYEIKVWEESEILDQIHPSRIDVYRKVDSNVKRADFARLEVLLNHGGVYLDCDLEPRLSMAKFFSKKKVERPRDDDAKLKKLSFKRVKVNLKSKSLIFSREWKNPRINAGMFTNRHRVANGLIMSIPDNPILHEYLHKFHKDSRRKTLHYLGPHSLTRFLTIKSRFLKPDDLCIIPPQHFLWEDQVGKMPKWSISKHMGKNTWGDHSKYDYWNV